MANKTTWVKNFGKSIKFSSIDLLKDTVPNMSEFHENNSETITELVKDLRDVRSSQKKLSDAVSTSPAIKYGIQAMRNMVKDFKSGKINNQDRMKKLYEDEFDVDMDFSPGDDFDTSDTTSVDTELMRSTATSTRETAISCNDISSGLNKQSSLLAEGFKTINETNKGIATTSLSLSHMNQKQNTQMMDTINKNLSLMIEFNNETMSKFAMGSLKFYEDNITRLDTIISRMDAPKDGEGKEEDDGYDRTPQFKKLFNNRGVIKLKDYPKVLGANFDRAVDSDFILSSIRDILKDEDGLKAMAANPLGSVSTYFAKQLMPVTIKKFMGQLDETFASFFPALLMKMNRYIDSDNPMMSFIGKMFGINTSTRISPDFSEYIKGAMPFNGMANKALVDIIPAHLASIDATLKGTEERIMDWETGTFSTKKDIKERLEREENDRLTGPFSKIMSEMTKNIESAIILSEEQRTNLEKDMISMFKEIAISGKLYNPLTDDLGKYGVDDATNKKLLAGAFSSLSRGKQMSSALATLKAQQDQSEYFDNISKDNAQHIASNLFGIYGGMPIDPNIERNEYNKNKFKVTKGNFGTGKDKYDITSVDYLRDIKEILLEGICVFPDDRSVGGKARNGRTTSARDSLSNRKDLYVNDKNIKGTRLDQEYNDDKPKELSKDQIEHAFSQGKLTFRDISNMDTKQLVNSLHSVKLMNEGSDKHEMGGVYAAIDKWVNGKTFGEKVTAIKDSIEQFFKAPLKMFTGAIDKIDSALYTIIYGDEEGNSIVNIAITNMKKTFSDFNSWMKKQWEKGKKFLLGDKDSITDTKMFKWAKGKAIDLRDYLFGTKDGDGVRKGGAFSSTFNSVGDIFKQVRFGMFGTAYKDSQGNDIKYSEKSVMGDIKKGVLEGFSQMRTYLFGEPKKDKDGKKVGFMDQVYDTLGEGYNNFKNFFFGTATSKEDGKKEFKDVMTDFKTKLPKAAAWGIMGAGMATLGSGSFGLLGSLFLPGGPITGAILGTTVGLLNQSEKFKNWLFGPTVDGSRVGGVVSKSVISFFAKNKTALLGGATFGAVKGLVNSTGILQMMGPLGYMTSLVLPGGPLTGAIFGAAIGLATRSNTFQNFLYGKKVDGKRQGGILGKMYGKSMKKHLPNVAFGATAGYLGGSIIGSMGLMGAMMTPAGPLGAAIMGASTGFAISSERFRKFMFGEIDKETGVKKSGFADRVRNMFQLSILEPFKLKVEKMSFGLEKWFTKNIANHVQDAMEPMKVQFKLLATNMKEMFVHGWQNFTTYIGGVFEKFVGKPFGLVMEEKVLKPLRSFIGGLINGVGKVAGFILSSPFKALSVMAEGMQKSQEEKGVRDNRKEKASYVMTSIYNSIFGAGNPEGMGVIDNIKNLFKSYGKTETEKSKSKYADYRDKEKKRKEERDKEQDQRFAEREQELKDKEIDINNRRAFAGANNFNEHMVDADGNVKDISDLYDLSKPIDLIGEEIKKSNNILWRIYYGFASVFKFRHGAPDKTSSVETSDTQSDNTTGDGDDVQKTVVDDIVNNHFGKDTKRILNKLETSLWKSINKVSRNGNQTEPSQTGDVQKDVIDSVINSETKDAHTFRKHIFSKLKGKVNKIFGSAKSILGNEKGAIRTDLLSPTSGESTTLKNIFKSTGVGNVIDFGGDGKNMANQSGAPKPVHADKTDIKSNEGDTDSVKGGVKYSIKKKSKYDKDDTKKSGLSRSQGSRLLDYVRIVAEEVNGQLNGVGSNVFKSRRLLEVIAQTNSDDMEGSGNKDRVSVFGKIKRKAIMLLTNPVLFMADILAKPFKFIFNFGEKIYNGIMGAGEAIYNMGASVLGGIKNTAVAAFKGLMKVPGMVKSVVSTAAGIATELLTGGAKMIVEFGLGTVTSIFEVVSGVTSAVGSMISGIGKGLKDMFHGIGKFAGEFFKGLGHFAKLFVDGAKAAFKIAGAFIEGSAEIVSTAVSSVSKVVVDTLGSVTNFILDTSQAVFSFLASPFKFLGKQIGKLLGMNKVQIAGGYLDNVKNVETVKIVEKVIYVNGGVGDGTKGEFVDGMFRRTSGYMNRIKASAREKLSMLKQEQTQTHLLGEISEETKKGNKAFGGFFKWIMTGATMLWGLLKKLKLPGIPNIPGVPTVTVKKVLKDFMKKNGSKTAERAAEGIAKRNISKPGIFTRAVNKVTTKVGDIVRGNKTLSEFSRLLKGKPAVEVGEAVGKKAVTDVGEKVTKNATDINMSKAESFCAKIKDLISKTFGATKNVLGNEASSVTTKILSSVSKVLNPKVLVKYVGKLSIAAAKTMASANPVGVVINGVLATWNITTGLQEAARIFRVDNASVTTGMRLAAALSKTIVNATPFALLSAFFDIYFAFTSDGRDSERAVAEFIYSFVADSKSIEELEAKQQAYADKAAKNGRTVDEQNEIDNKSVGSKIYDGFTTLKDKTYAWVSEVGTSASNALQGGVDWLTNNATWLGNSIGNNVKWGATKVADGIANNLQYIENGITNNKEYILNNVSEMWETLTDTSAKKSEEIQKKVTAWLDNETAYLNKLFLPEPNTPSVLSKVDSFASDVAKGVMDFWKSIDAMSAPTFDDMRKSVQKMLDKTDKSLGNLFGFKDADGNDMTFSQKAKKVLGFAGKGDGKFVGAGASEMNGHAYFSQEQGPWANSMYGGPMAGSSFKDTGCGPTAMAMVASDMTGKNITPDLIGKYSEMSGYRVPGGTTPELFSDFGSKMGLNPSEVHGGRDIINQLSTGSPVILGGRSGGDGLGNPFTKNGHYSVAVGLSKDGRRVKMNDPRGPQFSKEYDINQVINQTVTGYSFGNGFAGAGRRKPRFIGAGSITGDDILASAEQQIGLPYHLGGDGVSTTDCGKLTLDAFSRVGLDLGVRTADMQYKLFEQSGSLVDTKDAKPGDLVFFSSEDNGYAGVGHVGIYAGDNYILNAATSTGVAYADLANYWGDRIIGVGSVQKQFGVIPGKGKGAGAIKASAKGKGSKKKKGLLDIFDRVGDIFSNFSKSVLGGRIYTGTPEDDDDGDSSTSSGSLGAGSVDPKILYKTLRAKGYNDIAATAIMGNMRQENNLKTEDVPLYYVNGTEYGGIGLCHWTKSRADALRKFASESGRNPLDAGTQIDFMMDEINSGYKNVAPSALNNFSSAGEAALHFNEHYEGGTAGNRAQFAEEFYGQFKDFAGGGIGDVFKRKFNKDNYTRVFNNVRNGRNAGYTDKNSYSNYNKSVYNINKKLNTTKSSGVLPPITDRAKAFIAKKNAEAKSMVMPDLSTFKGGEYFNDANKVTKEAKAFVQGSGSLLDVAKSIGFKSIPNMDTPLSVQQQQMLGFREYNPIRTWSHYVTTSQLWKSSGKTSVDSWISNNPEFRGNGIGVKNNIPDSSIDKSIISQRGSYTGAGYANGSNDDILLRVVEILEDIADSNKDINKSVGKISKGDIIVDNGRGSSSTINVIKTGDNTPQILPQTKSNSLDYHKKISRGGNFVSR